MSALVEEKPSAEPPSLPGGKMEDIQKAYAAEAELIGRYLIAVTPNPASLALYAQAWSNLNVVMTPEEDKLWTMAKRYPSTLRIIDGGLALASPESAIRRKIYVMMAILEASPEYCEYFLPKRFSPLHGLRMVWSGLRAVSAGVIGYGLVKLVRMSRK